MNVGINVVITKCSDPGWEDSFVSLEEARVFFEGCVCKSCQVTAEEAEDIIKWAGLSEEQADDLLFDCKPPDYESFSDFRKLDWLMGTACGCEYNLDIYDVYDN